MTVQDWIVEKLGEISTKLPTLVHAEPASFSCGYNTGYKHALLDLERTLEEGTTLKTSSCWCGDKYHENGAVCL
jgi:hypothetical protein